MAHQSPFDTVLAENPSMEAVIRISRDGLPLESRSRTGGAVDEVVSLAAGLFHAAQEVGPKDHGTADRLFIRAGHGSLFIREEERGTLLLALTTDQCTEQQIEMMLLPFEPTAPLPENGSAS